MRFGVFSTVNTGTGLVVPVIRDAEYEVVALEERPISPNHVIRITRYPRVVMKTTKPHANATTPAPNSRSR